jgi:hypothetical protein
MSCTAPTVSTPNIHWVHSQVDFWKDMQLKQSSATTPAFQHFRNCVKALTVPVVVEVLRILAVWGITGWISFKKGHTERLENRRNAILRELKVRNFIVNVLHHCHNQAICFSALPFPKACL